MSFFSRLFGSKGAGSPANSTEPTTTAEIEYKGFVVRAAPRKEQGQFLVAGTIEKSVGGIVKQHRFVRADRSPNLDEITEMALAKARLMIDQQGDGVFG